MSEKFEVPFLEACRMLEMSDNTLRKMLREGKLNYRKTLTNRVFVEVESIEKLLNPVQKRFIGEN